MNLVRIKQHYYFITCVSCILLKSIFLSVFDDFQEMKDYSEISKGGRKSHLKLYNAFNELLAKISGSQDQTAEKVFLNAK